MNKKEFLSSLRETLAVLNEEELNDIIAEYEQHIDMKMASGLSEEEAIADFGDYKELTSELLEAYHLRESAHGLSAAAPHEGRQMAGHSNTAGFVKNSFARMWKVFMWCFRQICRPFVWLAGLMTGRGTADVEKTDGMNEDGRSEDGSGEDGSGEDRGIKDGIDEGRGIEDGSIECGSIEGGSIEGGSIKCGSIEGGINKGGSSTKGRVSGNGVSGNGISGNGIHKAGLRKFTHCVAGGIAAFCRWCVAVCVLCARQMWNACCLGVSALIGITGVCCLFMLGMFFVLWMSGYPLAGLSLAFLGAVMCLFAAMAFCMTLIWPRKRRAGALIECPAPAPEKEMEKENEKEKGNENEGENDHA